MPGIVQLIGPGIHNTTCFSMPTPASASTCSAPSPEKNIEKVRERQREPDQQVHTGSERSERERGSCKEGLRANG
jgi:hypothetical protein